MRSQAFSRIRTFPTLDFGVPDPSLKLGWAEAGNAKRLQLLQFVQIESERRERERESKRKRGEGERDDGEQSESWEKGHG